MRSASRVVWVAFVMILLVSAQAAFAQRDQRPPGPRDGVYKASIAPHWFANDTKFWYRNELPDGKSEFILVDAEAGKREPAFEHDRLAKSLSKALAKTNYRGDKLPFESVEFVDDGKAVEFKVKDHTWKCDLESYECAQISTGPATTQSAAVEERMPEAVAEIDPSEQSPQVDTQPATSQAATTQAAGRGFRGDGDPRELATRPRRSPDRNWTAFIQDRNVFVRRESDGKEIQLSRDGKDGFAYGRLEWSPDSSTLVSYRIEPGERKDVYRIESSPRGGGRAILHTDYYALPGDKFNSLELNVFDVAGQKQIKPDVERIDFDGTGGNPNPRLHWSKDGHHFAYQKDDRGHQRLRLIEVDTRSGETRNLIDEKTDTFIWTAHTENLNLSLITWLEKSNEVLYVSEKDGWRHLYLVGVESASMKQITRGEYVLRGIDRVDEEKRQIWFRAGGKNKDQDPYLIHYYRVNFDGSGLVALTEGNGNHSISYSPDRKYIVDSYSRVDMAPVNELRRVSDGKLVCKLEESDITELKKTGWQAPEVFTAKGRDGKTDIWGIIVRPRDLDSKKKYPVLESIYNGPQGAYVPKSFSIRQRFSNLVDAGFIVVQMDAMGTAFRSKAFHDVCWHNLGDGGFPDRIAWHKAAGAKYPYYDLSRVGIFGNSAGGQNAAAAVIFHPDFYKASVANSGCHDNRMDKSSWNEQWMGYPVGPQYSKSSNIDNASKLGAYLMLIVGEMDNNVPPESTFRLVDALTKARKDFDLVVVPGANHGAASPITQRRIEDFFVRHLMGKEPPNRNAGESQNATSAADQ